MRYGMEPDGLTGIRFAWCSGSCSGHRLVEALSVRASFPEGFAFEIHATNNCSSFVHEAVAIGLLSFRRRTIRNSRKLGAITAFLLQ